MRFIECKKLGQKLQGFDKPPWPGELGQRIVEEISQDAWRMWLEHAKMLIKSQALRLICCCCAERPINCREALVAAVRAPHLLHVLVGRPRKLDRDVEDLSSLLTFLRDRRGAKQVALLGHSTGCQITVCFLVDDGTTSSILAI